jgi:hypothetical protein
LQPAAAGAKMSRGRNLALGGGNMTTNFLTKVDAEENWFIIFTKKRYLVSLSMPRKNVMPYEARKETFAAIREEILMNRTN